MMHYQHLLSRLAGSLTNSRISWLKNFLIDLFIYYYDVDITEAWERNPHAYASFNDFFTRHLKPEARTFSQKEQDILSPVDGQVMQIGRVIEGSILQAKGFEYSVLELLGGEQQRANCFINNGHFATFYLSPRDYHRVHMPFSGVLQEMIYVPGQLFSVNARSANKVPHLFARNERVIAVFESPAGKFALVLVGALLVGSIYTLWHGKVNANRNSHIMTWNYQDQNIHLKKGEEMGYFELGSTVILLLEPNFSTNSFSLEFNQDIKLGQYIGEAHIPNTIS